MVIGFMEQLVAAGGVCTGAGASVTHFQLYSVLCPGAGGLHLGGRPALPDNSSSRKLNLGGRN